MKTKIIKNIFLFVFISSMLLAFGGCSKYEDGPWISFTAASNRMNGTWRVESFLKNDNDLIQQWKDNYDWKFTFGDYVSDGMSHTWNINMTKIPDDIIPDTVSSFYNSGIYRIEDDFTKLFSKYFFLITDTNPSGYIIISEGCGMYPFISSNEIDFTISKLRMDKLWLKTSDNLGNQYTIKFLKE